MTTRFIEAEKFLRFENTVAQVIAWLRFYEADDIVSVSNRESIIVRPSVPRPPFPPGGARLHAVEVTPPGDEA